MSKRGDPDQQDVVVSSLHGTTGERAVMLRTIQQSIDSLPFYVLLIDDHHHIHMVNSTTTQSLGIESAALIGHFCPKAVHQLDEPFPGCPLEEAVATGHSVSREFYDARTERWISAAIYATPFVSEEGRPLFLHMASDVSDRKRAEDEVQRSERIKTLLNTILGISLLPASMHEQLDLILSHVMSIPWLGLEQRGAIFLVREQAHELVMEVQRGLHTSVQETCRVVPFGQCLCGLAAATNQVIFSDGLEARHTIQYPGITAHGHYCIPIAQGEQVLGILTLYVPSGHPYSADDEKVLLSVAHVIAGIIIRKRAEEDLACHAERLRCSMESTIRVLSSVVEQRDPYTAGHQMRVASLAVAIAREMGFTESAVQGIHTAALIHDIGKNAVPASILTKPGRLNDAEFTLIKTHAQAAYDILRNVEFPWPIAEPVLQHHERMDGSGYPQRLAGEQICREARIIAVADVVEAIASHRPYRPALGIDVALTEIMVKRGLLYDPAAVDACLYLFENELFTFPPSDSLFGQAS